MTKTIYHWKTLAHGSEQAWLLPLLWKTVVYAVVKSPAFRGVYSQLSLKNNAINGHTICFLQILSLDFNFYHKPVFESGADCVFLCDKCIKSAKTSAIQKDGSLKHWQIASKWSVNIKVSMLIWHFLFSSVAKMNWIAWVFTKQCPIIGCPLSEPGILTIKNVAPTPLTCMTQTNKMRVLIYQEIINNQITELIILVV